MAIDIGTQLVIIIIFGFMALLAKKNSPEVAKVFGWAILVLIGLFSVVDIIDSVGLIKF